MARIQKQQFRNMTQGWIGAIVIGPKGEESGVPIEAGGTIWLSEEEQILTANAPRYPQDNPFIEQTHIVLNPETNAREEQPITPLVAISENRFVPANERPIGADLSQAQDTALAGAAATGEEPVTLNAVAGDALTRHAEVAALGADAVPGQPATPVPDSEQPQDGFPPIPPAAATNDSPAAAAPPAAPEAPAAPPAAEAPAPPASAPQEAATVSLPATPTPPGADPSRAVPADEGRVASEETAAQSPGPASEETGAAVQPAGEATAGSFAPGEEVGTPSAPAAPAPWTPSQG